ncbi:MAG TPA: biopolymer transporter ExbD [Flavihumibacter sp.]|nr:biopolymer transporter ExbD [Flavihumibacter sp.]
MAEINNATAGKRRSLRVDLTPMVDLGFLLISFFIFTTTLSAMKEVRFYLPADGPPVTYGASTSLTLVPAANNRVWYFDGTLDEAKANNRIKQTGYALNNGIGDIIRAKQKQLEPLGKKKELSVLICPSAASSYGNIVDLMDEMLINKVSKYAVSDDTHLLAALDPYLTKN